MLAPLPFGLLSTNRFNTTQPIRVCVSIKQCFTNYSTLDKMESQKSRSCCCFQPLKLHQQHNNTFTQRHQSFYFHRLSVDVEKEHLRVSRFKQQNRTHIDAQIGISLRVFLNKLSDFRISTNTKGMNTQLRTLHFFLLLSSIPSCYYDLFYWIICAARSALIHQFCTESNNQNCTCRVSDECRQFITRRT